MFLVPASQTKHGYRQARSLLLRQVILPVNRPEIERDANFIVQGEWKIMEVETEFVVPGQQSSKQNPTVPSFFD